MTEKRSTEIRVGILILAAVAAVAGFVLLLGDVHFGTMHRIHADFESTGGIKKGAPVRMIGVSIGKVTEIGIVKGAQGTGVMVRVTAEIPEKEFALIPSDVSASISSMSMLGEKHLELTPPPREPGSTFKPVADDAVLSGRSPAGLESLGGDASELVRKVSVFIDSNEESLSGAITEIRGLARRANEFMDANRPKLDETVENLRTASGTLSDGISRDKVSRIITRADSIMRRFDQATAGIEASVPRLVGDVERLSGHADTLVVNATKMIDGISGPATTAVGDIQAITTDARAGRGTLGKILTNSSIFDDFAAFAADIKAHPWKLLFKR